MNCGLSYARNTTVTTHTHAHTHTRTNITHTHTHTHITLHTYYSYTVPSGVRNLSAITINTTIMIQWLPPVTLNGVLSYYRVTVNENEFSIYNDLQYNATGLGKHYSNLYSLKFVISTRAEIYSNAYLRGGKRAFPPLNFGLVPLRTLCVNEFLTPSLIPIHYLQRNFCTGSCKII